MSLFSNLSFDAAGASAGLAEGWTIAVQSSVESIAEFANGLAVETFEEGWLSEPYSPNLDDDRLDTAKYHFGLQVVPSSVENFEVGWDNNQTFTFDLTRTELAKFNASIEGVSTQINEETFESEWLNTTFSSAIGTGEDAPFSGAGVEAFDNWTGTNTYSSDLVEEDTEAATYYSGARDREDFETVFAPVLVTVDPSTDVFTAVGHGFADGHRVTVVSSGQLPQGLNATFEYSVVHATSDTFKLSASPGTSGASVDIQSTGTGEVRVVPNQALYWTTKLED